MIFEIRVSRPATALACAFLGVLLEAEPALAVEPEAPVAPEAAPVGGCAGDATACGKEQFELGARAFEQKDYASAIRHFERAQALRPHPVIGFNLGLSLAAAGRLLDAVATLEAVIADPHADAALAERAKQESSRARSGLAEVRFHFKDPENTSIEIDGVPRDSKPARIALDPGRHHVKVTSTGVPVYDEEVTLAPGERVELRLSARARAIDIVIVPQQRRAVRPPPDAPKRTERGLSSAWFWGGVATTGLLAGATIVSGLDTLRAHDEYEHDLADLSQDEADARVEAGHDKELRTNVLLGATLVTATATAVLGAFFVDFGGGPASVSIGPSGARCRVRF